jgi:protein-tyrosine phosphatase
MHTELYWIDAPFPGRLAVAPRPRGGDWLDDEMRAWHDAGIKTVVSLLTPGEVAEFDLSDEAAASAARGMRFVNLPVPDRDTPASRAEFRELVSGIADDLAAGRGVAVHCRQGIGRAGLTAAGVLVAAGLDPEEAVRRVSSARGRAVPETPAQRRWLDGFAAEYPVAAGEQPHGGMRAS